MIMILDGNLEHVAHDVEKKVFSEKKKIRFVTALDLIKCLEHIK